jgi:xanthine dehydrogenase accessory factor
MVPILLEIARLAPGCPYVGVMGSEVKGIKIKKELAQADVNLDFINKLRVPMGLKLGSNHPEEIAISIAAELLLMRDEGQLLMQKQSLHLSTNE